MSDSGNPPILYGARLQKQPDQKFCHACGCLLHLSAQHCITCGATQFGPQSNSLTQGAVARLLPHHIFCRGCGQPLHETAPYCPHCGAPQQNAAARADTTPKSRGMAVFLAFILGGVGAHKFYLGSAGLGILYIIFCWTFIPAIIGLIEGIVYLCTSDQEFSRRYR